MTSTGYCNEIDIDYSKYRIPSGTFYVNRTANLLNMYLGAIYGQDKYVESCFYNQIYLNIKQIEQKKINTSELLSRSQTFLMQLSGVSNVFTSKNLLLSGDSNSSRLRNWFYPNNCGDLVVEVSPGWKAAERGKIPTIHFKRKHNAIPSHILWHRDYGKRDYHTNHHRQDCADNREINTHKGTQRLLCNTAILKTKKTQETVKTACKTLCDRKKHCT